MDPETLPRIVKDSSPLSEEFLPSSFPGRHGLLQALYEAASPVAGMKPRHAWISGPPGAGKTSAVRSVLHRLEEQRVRTAYVNCWSSQTFFAVLEAVLQELRALVGDTRDAAFKYDRLVQAARDQPLVVVLDEIDQLFLKERNATLYNLARLERTGLVGVSQSRSAYLALDSRVRSRLNPLFIDFSPYRAPGLSRILEQRAGEALHPDSWCSADLDLIAKGAEGDARVAIQTLRSAAYLAERKRIPMISGSDIAQALRSASQLRRQYFLKQLSEHHRLLYQIVKEAGEITSRDLWLGYVRAARERGLQPIARRTWNHYKQYLLAHRLLEEKQGRGRQNTRIVRVVE